MGKSGRAVYTTVVKGVSRGGQFCDGHDTNRANGHDRVGDHADTETAAHDFREDFGRIPCLFGHIDRIFEADHSEERQRCRGAQGQERVLVVGCFEGDRPAEISLAAGDEVDARADDQQQAAELDEGQQDVDFDAFAHAAQVEDHQHDHEAEGNQHDAAGNDVKVEALDEISCEGPRSSGCGSDAG